MNFKELKREQVENKDTDEGYEEDDEVRMADIVGRGF